MRHPRRTTRSGSCRRLTGRLLAVVVFMAVGAILPRVAVAGGLNLYEIGSPDTGLAGAGYAARAQDASTVFTNPAGMIRIIDSQFLFGIQPMYGDLDFDRDRNTTVSGGDGGNPVGWIPSGSAFYVHSLSPDLKVGAGLLGYFGLSADYGSKWLGRYQVVAPALMGLTLMPAAAYRISDQFSVGAGLNAMYGMMSAEVMVNNVQDSLPDGRLEVEDETWGFGGEFGVLYEPCPGTRFGLTYMTPVDLDFSASPKFRNLGPGFDAIIDRSDLRSLDLAVTVPQSLMASFYHELDDRFALLGNVGWQDWSRFGKFGVEVASADPKSLTVDMNYRDTWHFALGTQYRPAPEWVFSCGVAYDTSMMKDRDRTAGVPPGAAWRIGLGAQYELSDACTLGFAYGLVYSSNLPIDQERGPLSGRVSGEFERMLIHVFTISIIWKP
jgi:long-chain fatty acid transport protein